MNIPELTIDVKAKVTVDRKTAEACLRLVEMYMNDTCNFIECSRTTDGDVSLRFREGNR